MMDVCADPSFGERLLRIERDLAMALSSTNDLTEALRLCLRAAQQIDGMDCGGIYLVDGRTGGLELAEHRGLPADFIAATRRYAADAPQTRLALAGKPIYTRHAFLTDADGADRQQEGLRALAVLPILHQGQVIAALNLASHTCDEFTPAARDAAEAIASQVGGAITRVRAAEALRASEANLHNMFDALDDMLFILDAGGHILAVNPAVERLLGYTASELRGQHVLAVHPPERRQEASAIIARMLAGEATRCPVPLLTRAGAHIPVQTRVVSGQWSGQDVLFGVSRDVSEEDRIRTALVESEKYYRRLIEEAPIGVVIYDLSSAARPILFANAFARNLWREAGGGDLVGASVLQLCEPADFASLLALGHGQEWVHGIETRLKLPNGQIMPALLSAGEVTYQGRPAELLFVNDLRELTQIQEALRQQELTLAAVEEREQVARDLHDGLGQALAYLNVQAQVAQTFLTDGKTAAVQTALQQMAQASQEAQAGLRNYILGLRAAGRPSSDLLQTLETTLLQFEEQWGIAATLSAPERAPGPIFAAAVEEQVLRIVQEALANIRKHARAHKVNVYFSFVGEQAQILIADDGAGFDLNAARAEQGDAPHFGLSIMRERAAMVGGRCEIRSASGKGTQVLLTVPRGINAADAATRGEGPAIPNLRVLLVDDHPLFLDGLRNLLTARGSTVVGVAHDGLEALEQARALQPDVVVMDVDMPRCNGVEATLAIKSEMPHIKVVMLTVSEDTDNLFAALRNGASGYLLKSLDVTEFYRLLADVMRGQATLPQALASRVLSDAAQSQPPAPAAQGAEERLSARQWEILKLVARGLTYKEIAALQHLSEQSIKYHMGQILERLHVASRAQAIAYLSRNVEEQ